MPRFIFLIIGIFLSVPSLWAQLPPAYTEPVPLDAGNQGEVEPNANNIIFFPHYAIPESARNFRDFPTTVYYGLGNDRQVVAWDLAGAPGFPPSEVKKERENMRAMLTDPFGLCHENFLINLLCEEDELANPDLNQASWQQLVADLRNYLPGEPKITGLDSEVQNVTLAGNPDLPPYDKFGFGSIIATEEGGWSPFELEQSPPPICYDIAWAEEWLACPVFGKVYLRDALLRKLVPEDRDLEIIEIQSPILLYRHMKDERYHLVGYLANPTLFDYQLFDDGNETPRHRSGNHYFPVSIAAANFSDEGGAAGKKDIAVMSWATIPNVFCSRLNQIIEGDGLERLPWGLNCTYGITWIRVNPIWSTPRETFDSLHYLLGAPRIYNMASGEDSGKGVIFAPSNMPAPDGKFYVLKYYDENYPPIENPGEVWPRVPFVVYPRLIEVIPPQEDFGPFKVDALDFNLDGYSDFALTWKHIEDQRVSAAPNTWKGTYSSYFSVFISRRAEEQTVYDQFNFQVPKLNANEIDTGAQLAAVAFGVYQEQAYLVVGNAKRMALDEENYHAYNYLFPINGGIVDNLNVKVVKASFKEGDDRPGVADIAQNIDGSGVIASVIRDPFLPAPESCLVPERGLYGSLWLGRTRQVGQNSIDLLDFDHDGIPNRCECLKLGGTPDETNDPDFDEIAKACDACPLFSLDFETDEEGRLVGDGTADACDNCPPTRCEGGATSEGISCLNLDQADSDDDGVGNACDACPDSTNLMNGGVYAWGSECIEFCSTGIDCCTPNLCTFCAFGHLMQDGRFRWYVNDTQIFNDGCDDDIKVPHSLSSKIDIDEDGVPNPRDNCVYIYNPPAASFLRTSGNESSGQADSDDDGSGDACDCATANRWDDCDGDGVPNRFDETPTEASLEKGPTNLRFTNFQPPDTVYDPYAGYIANVRNLKSAQGLEINIFDDNPIVVDPAQIRIIGFKKIPLDVCGYPANAYPGPNPCDYMGPSGREVTVVLPTEPRIEPPPLPCVVGEDPACTPPPTAGTPETGAVIPISQYCIAKVGRKDPRTAAIFDWEREQIIAANDKAQAITGIKDFDIFVGAEGGAIHWECAFAAGAYPSAAMATNVLPNISGNVAPYVIAQLNGLPPITYERRPDPTLLIQKPQALVLAPLQGPTEEGAGVALSLMPDLNIVLPDREASRLSSVGVQFGHLRQNINGKMVYKVLNAQDNFAAEGTFLAVNEFHSLMAIDFKAYPEPWTQKPVEERMDNPDTMLRALEQKVAQWKQRGLPITLDIYRELPWEKHMYAEFLVAQNTVPEAITQINQSLSAQEGAQPIPEGQIHRIVLPAYVKPYRFGTGGGGCGCRMTKESITFATLLYLLCLLIPFPVWIYYRQKNLHSRRKCTT